MKKGYIRLLIICLIFMIITTFNVFINILNEWSLILVLTLTLAISLALVKFEKDNMRAKKDVMLIVIIYALAYLLITYLMGLFVGFYRTPYSLELQQIVRNITPVLLIIILSEIMRYTLVIKAERYKSILILITMIFIILDITLIIHTFDFNLSDDILRFIVAILIPVISKNILLTYLSLKAGYKSPIIYRLFFELPIFLVPILPNFGLYIGSLLNLVNPALLAYIIYLNLNKLKPQEPTTSRNKKSFNIILIIIALPILILIALTTNWFSYGAVTIGSGSMAPEIRRGDVIIVERLEGEDFNTLEEGEILIFRHEEIIIVHRIVRIIEVNGNRYFYTKGDANEAEDGWPITEDNIIGRASLRIPLIGLPTVWLNDLIN